MPRTLHAQPATERRALTGRSPAMQTHCTRWTICHATTAAQLQLRTGRARVMGSAAVPARASTAGRISNCSFLRRVGRREKVKAWSYIRMSCPGPATAHGPRPRPWPCLALGSGSGPGSGSPLAPARRSVNSAAFQRRWVRSAGRPGTPHVDPPYKPPPPGAADLLRPGAGPSGSTATVEGPVRPA